jgi:hypothetical protein
LTQDKSQKLEIVESEQNQIRLQILQLEKKANILKRRLFGSSDSTTSVKNAV